MMSGSSLTYQQAIDWVFGLINFERKPGRSRDFRLDRTRALLAAVGDPHKQIPAVHIAGTKGKGSTATMIAAALKACGVTTGLFTSPHISKFEERFRVDGDEPTEDELVELVQELRQAVEKCDGLMPTYFEAAMVLGWCFFRNRGVKLAVLEVGLGGRLDATNVCEPKLCIITSISLDHTNVLGDTLDKIAAEKAGIIKPEIPVISGVIDEPARGIIRGFCERHKCELTELDRDIGWQYRPPKQNELTGTVDIQTPWSVWQDIHVPLAGKHQAFNTTLAVSALDQLSNLGIELSVQKLREGLSAAFIPARVEVISRDPLMIVDAAHNEASIAALTQTLDEISSAGPRVCVFATTKLKDTTAMLRHIASAFDYVVLTKYLNNPRAVPIAELEAILETLRGEPNVRANLCVSTAPTPAAALQAAKSVTAEPAMICTTGSFFIAAEVRELVMGEQTKAD